MASPNSWLFSQKFFSGKSSQSFILHCWSRWVFVAAGLLIPPPLASRFSVVLSKGFHYWYPSKTSKIFQNSNLLFFEFHFVGNKAKGRILKQVFQENKALQIFRKTNISYPLIRTRTCAYQGVRNVRFSENLACFVFLKHPFLDSPFCLITGDLSNNVLILVRMSEHWVLLLTACVLRNR